MFVPLCQWYHCGQSLPSSSLLLGFLHKDEDLRSTVSADMYTHTPRGPSVCLIRWATVSFVWFSVYFSVFGVYPLFLSLNVRVFMSSLSMLDIILAHVMKLIYNSRIVRGAYLLVLSIQRARFMKKGPGLLIMYFRCLQWVPRTTCGHSVYFSFLVLMTSKFILIPFIWWDPAYHIDLGRYKVSGILPTLTC